jgi:hypothetical protein
MADERAADAAETRGDASVVDLTFGIWALIIPFLVQGRLLNADGDLPRHLVIGEHILREGPRFDDVFSFTMAGEPFLAYEWLSQVLLYLVHRVGGLPLVAIFAGLIIAAALAQTVRYVRRGGMGDPWFAFMMGALAAILTGPHWIARPHLFSFLALPTLLLTLDRWGKNPLPLALLFALWANLHPGFLYGLVILAVYLAGDVIEGWFAGRRHWGEAGRATLAWTAAAAGSLANPFGWSLHAHALEHASNVEFVRTVQEFLPLDPVSGYGAIFMAVVGLVLLGLSAQRERVSLGALGVFLAGMFGTVVAQRNGPLLAVSGLPMIARELTPVVKALPRRFLGRMRSEFQRSDGRARKATSVSLGVLAIVALLGGRVGPVTLIADTFSDDFFPVDAVAWAEDDGLSGRLLSEYEWGGYVLFAWEGQRVFVDSMADFYGRDLVFRFGMMRDAVEGWEDDLNAFGISVVLMQPGRPLVARLREDPSWAVQYEDETAVVMVRSQGPVSEG